MTGPRVAEPRAHADGAATRSGTVLRTEGSGSCRGPALSCSVLPEGRVR